MNNLKQFHILTLIVLVVFCYPMSVKSEGSFNPRQMKELTMDRSAQTQPRVDLNGEKCALVKLILLMPDIGLEGNVVGTPEFRNGEYWIYVTPKTKMLKIKHSKYMPCLVDFSKFKIPQVESGVTYELIVEVKNDDPEEIRRLKEYAQEMDSRLLSLQDSLQMVTETDQHKFYRAIETKNFELLKSVAESGYEKAYLPLANEYMNKNDLYEAEKWAKKAIYVDGDTMGAKFILLGIKNRRDEEEKERNDENNKKNRILQNVFPAND